MVSHIEEVKGLLVLARDALSRESEQGLEDFLERVDTYLSRFENWHAEMVRQKSSSEGLMLSEAERDSLSLLLRELVKVHQEVVEQALAGREGLADKLGELHRRGNALKAYVDHYPSRVSITGKRKG